MSSETLATIQKLVEKYCNETQTGFNPNQPGVRLNETTSSAEEINAALETLLSTYTTMGKKVRAFENQYADYVNMKYAVMSNSGSSSNLLSIAAIVNPATPDHLKPGDEVIVPALSWSTTIWPLIQHQLLPVLVDCDIDSFNFDLVKLEAAIGPKTRAIKLVHVYGNPCNMDAIMALAKKHNLIVIEDCCEAMGASYDNKAVGSFGLISNYSFFFAHHISTMEGGISVSNDFNITETLRILRAHGWSREADEHQKYVNQYPDIDPRFIFINLGYNMRPTEVNAAMGQVQLPKLDGFIDIRRKYANDFLNSLEKYSEFFGFQTETPKGKHVWFSFPIIVKENPYFSMKELSTHLHQNRIENRPIIAGNMARHPAFKMYEHKIAGDLSSADIVMKQGLALPCHQSLTDESYNYMIDTIDTFMAQALNKQNKKTA